MFLYFIKREHFENYEKWFLFPLRSSFPSGHIKYFVAFFLLFPQFPDSKGETKKRNFSKHALQLKKRLVTSYRPFLIFMILPINRDLVQRKKSN